MFKKLLALSAGLLITFAAYAAGAQLRADHPDTYVVKKGDTLGAIARRYRVTTAQLMRWNGIKNAHKLRLGQRIRIEGR